MDEMDLLGEDCSMTDADPIAAVPGKKEKKKKEKCEIIHMSTCRLCMNYRDCKNWGFCVDECKRTLCFSLRFVFFSVMQVLA
jgi:hypothetical protein